MKEVGLYEAKTTLSALVAGMEATGEGVALTRHGKVVAELHPPVGRAPKRGCLKSTSFRMARDFDADAMGFEDFFGDEPVVLQAAEPKGSYKTKRKGSR
ncbi:MAG: type II toxin-antitoxin system Phd/YefM family antitoxin [Verrucomicrobia subdivision 3 bacterium]|nr:type II toxin-antitoxin system Phd/YefM family antitoxin [Limisphaerales bacterium]